jgi:outer membrane cobalamin receptor
VVGNLSAEAPADITVLDSTELETIPGLVLDDRLRQVPGFTLFRRSSSLVAHPTTQGLSLRGIGSSGASRTLVLWDGIPANDPFGGWVYWTRFIPDDISRVEISRGAPTSIFGNLAMSGAVALFSVEPSSHHLIAEYESGNEGTQDVTAGFSNVWGRTAVSGTARAFTTDGYYIVPTDIRGAADRPANVRFATGDIHLDQYTSVGNFFFRFDALAEERHNGTALTHNSTGLGTVSLHYSREFSNDSLSITGYHEREQFHSSFSAISADRNTERLTYLQTVPSQATGGAALWQHHDSRWDLTGGGDVDRVSGTSTDHLFPTGLRIGGGSQFQHGLFAQADARFGPARFFAGLRHSFAGGGYTFLSPSAGVVAGAGRFRFRGSVYRSFRAPTLNELYREFRVGNTVTLANTALAPETLDGAEAGVDWLGENTTFRVTAYRNALHGLITNVTLSTAPNSIVRQRENAAAALARGVEADFRRRWRNWTAEAGYLFADSRYANGLRIAQVPLDQGSGQITYQRGGTLASVGVRAFGSQFDDDLNQFLLPGFTTFEVMAMQHLAGSLSAEAAVENALDRVYYTAFTPFPNIGEPRLWRVGLRWNGRVW